VRTVAAAAAPADALLRFSLSLPPLSRWLILSFQDARMGAINSSNGIDDILKRAMGNRSSLFKRT